MKVVVDAWLFSSRCKCPVQPEAGNYGTVPAGETPWCGNVILSRSQLTGVQTAWWEAH